MEGFKEGYKFAEQQASLQYAATLGEEYIEDVNNGIDELVKQLGELAQKNIAKSDNILSGDMAEIWHADTFNINSIIKMSADHATAGRSNDLGSVDVKLDSGAEYSLKYYSTGKESAKAQAVSAFEEYKHNGGKLSLDEYLLKHSELTRDQAIGSPLYDGQFRLCPDNQVEDIKAFLKRKILEEQYRDDGQAQRYQDALDKLAESQGHAVIDNGDGVRSIPLTKVQSTELAKLAKENKIDPAKWGLTTAQRVSFQDILKGAYKAGMSAALIDAVLKVAPEIYKALDYLIKNGNVDKDDIKRIGVSALKGATQGFFIGGVTYSITTACKAGIFGESLQSINPHVAGALAVVIYNVIGNAISVAQGKMTTSQMSEAFTRDIYMSVCMITGGGALSSAFGPIGYLVGTLLGSIIGGFTYTVGKQLVISVCIEHGFTAFGLVEQDYSLPDSVLDEIGVDVFTPETFSYEEFLTEAKAFDDFEYETMEYQTFDIQVLRRGVIGINKIGYLTA